MQKPGLGSIFQDRDDPLFCLEFEKKWLPIFIGYLVRALVVDVIYDNKIRIISGYPPIDLSDFVVKLGGDIIMILEHNTIVNRSISATIQQLVRGEDLSGAAKIDPKGDVMPSQSAAEEQLGEFKNSVNEHVAMVANIGKLRGTLTAPHPIFGDLDAHMWNCMFSFHLSVHYQQAEHVVRMASANRH